MKNETLLELFNFYGSAHILHSHRGGMESLKCLHMIMGEGIVGLYRELAL